VPFCGVATLQKQQAKLSAIVYHAIKCSPLRAVGRPVTGAATFEAPAVPAAAAAAASTAAPPPAPGGGGTAAAACSPPPASGGTSPHGLTLVPSTFRLNVSALCGIGGAFKGHLGECMRCQGN